MEDIISSIVLCQKKLEKYAASDDEAKLIYYLSKLKHLPIKVSHLEQTGVGRSVNALRHINGSVGERARNLVGVWKKMVTAEEGSSGREQHDRGGERRSSVPSVATARASPRPSKQQPPTPQSPEEVEDDEDCERLQIEEAADDAAEEVEVTQSPERLDPNCYDPSQPASDFSNRLNTNGNKYMPTGSSYGRSGSDSDHGSPIYDPYTSRQDYQSAGVSNEPLEYQPTHVVSPGGLEEEKGGSPVPSEEGREEPTESVERALDSKSKNKHKDRKKHKGRDREKSLKDKHRHKSSDKEKEKSHKDKRKEKERSPKKSKNISDQLESTKEDLDRRRSKSHKSSDNDYYSPNSPGDISLVNGHVLPDIVTASDNSVASSSKDKSSSKPSSSKSSSSRSKEVKKDDKEKRDKKDKKRSRDNDTDHQSKNDHKGKKRKSDNEEGFGAALMGLNEEAPSKPKKSKSHSKDKDDRSHKSKNSTSSKSSPSKSHNSSGHSSRQASEKKVASSSGSQAPSSATNSLPAPLPEIDVISPNYKPLPRVPLPESLSLDDLESYPSFLPSFVPVTEAPHLTQEQTLDRMLTSKGKTKRQIYSGKARAAVLTAVPSLFNLSVKCLQENIDALEFTGGIPYDLLKPVFEKATATQLFNLENYNPYLLEDTHNLWEQHCKKDFKGKKLEEMETYRDMYMRLTDERTQKLKSLTENLQSKFVTKPPPRRQTQLAFVGTVAKPPKSVARAQAKYGTGVPVGTPARTTKAAEILARKQAMQNMQRVERTTGGGASNGPGARPSAASKKPRAPLMAKTMQFYKKTFRR